MTATVTWDALRELALFRAESGCAISLYLDLDPSTTPTPADARARLNSLLVEAERTAAATRDELSHARKQGLRDDVERMRTWFDTEFSREGTRGLALFASGPDGVWRPLPLPGPVADRVVVNRSFAVAPLVPVLGRGERVLLAVVGRERGDVYLVRQGTAEPLADLSEDAPRRHDQGGWSQANMQRHIDELEADHFRDVADEVDRAVRRGGVDGIVVVCAEEKRPRFADLLSQEAKDVLVGWASAEAHAGTPELLAAAEPHLERWRAGREEELLDRWRREAATGGRASSGWQETLDAASDGRVEVLLFAEGAGRPAFECPECGRASASAGPCPLDGAPLEEQPDGLDLAVQQTLAHGGRVLAVGRGQGLSPVEGVAALLRF